MAFAFSARSSGATVVTENERHYQAIHAFRPLELFVVRLEGGIVEPVDGRVPSLEVGQGFRVAEGFFGSPVVRCTRHERG